MFLHKLFPVKTVADLERQLYYMEIVSGLMMAACFVLVPLGMLFSPLLGGVLLIMAGVFSGIMGAISLRDTLRLKKKVRATKPTDSELLTFIERHVRGDVAVEQTVMVMKKAGVVKSVTVTKISTTEYEN